MARSDAAGRGSIGPRHSSGERRTPRADSPRREAAASSGRGDDDRSAGSRRAALARSGRAGGKRSGGNTLLSALTELVVVLSMALVLSLLIKTFLVQAFYIPSDSMQNSLQRGDRVVVSKLTPGPFSLHRGDVIVFKDPGDWLPASLTPEDTGVRKVIRRSLTFVGLLPQDSGEHLIKRVIGLPGDKVACCDSQGRITVNGVALNEHYLYPGDVPSTVTFSVTVPADHLWVMGDHRSVSKDSRYNEIKFVPIENVVGKAFVVVWPLSRAGRVTGSGTTFDDVPAAGS